MPHTERELSVLKQLRSLVINGRLWRSHLFESTVATLHKDCQVSIEKIAAATHAPTDRVEAWLNGQNLPQWGEWPGVTRSLLRLIDGQVAI